MMCWVVAVKHQKRRPVAGETPNPIQLSTQFYLQLPPNYIASILNRYNVHRAISMPYRKLPSRLRPTKKLPGNRLANRVIDDRWIILGRRHVESVTLGIP